VGLASFESRFVARPRQSFACTSPWIRETWIAALMQPIPSCGQWPHVSSRYPTNCLPVWVLRYTQLMNCCKSSSSSFLSFDKHSPAASETGRILMKPEGSARTFLC
jgi:hypothetical protein